MNTHYRNYEIRVNGKSLSFLHSVEAISDSYIKLSQQNCVEEQTKLGRIKEGDNVEFIFKFCNT